MAARLAGQLASPGPTAARDDLVDLVATLRAAAVTATAHAARITELVPADGTDPATDPVSLVQVVDRPGWALANVRMLAAMTASVGGESSSTGTRLAGATQVGGVLALLAGKVLGQFDPFTADARAPHGRLLLVAPNVLQVERALGVDPADFRLWIALHEQTHALQFAAAPWLVDHLREGASALLDDLGGIVPGTGHSGHGRRGQDDSPSFADVLRIASRVVVGPGYARSARSPHTRPACAARRGRCRDVPAGGPCRRRDGRGRLLGRAVRPAHPCAVRGSARRRCELARARARAAPAARPRREARAVPGRRDVRA
jgi:hypothetical protein